MSEQANNKPQIGIAVLRQYIKDLSFEVLADPIGKVEPKIEVSVDVNANQKENQTFDVGLNLNLKAMQEDKILFILELSYVANAKIDAPLDHIEPILMIEIPRLMFPFARNIVTHCLMEGSQPQIMLNPIDFAGLYMARKQAQAKSQEAPAN